MATIKERVAALNLAEKLHVRPSALGVIGKNYQSSSSWSGLIAHLKLSVKVKHRRILLKSHEDCFLGSEAVDVVADHLSLVKCFEGASVPRDKVVCVCQALLDCKVFEAVGTKVFGKDKNPDVFRDCKNALYRFLSAHSPSVDELERGVLSYGIQKFFGTGPSDGLSQDDIKPLHSTPVQLCSPSIRVHSPANGKHMDASATASQLLVTAIENLSLSPSGLQTDSMLPQTLVNDVWQEQTTIRLLKLVDLPLLDGVLQCSLNQGPHSPLPHLDLTYSSNKLDRQIIKAFRESQQDEWLRAALDCLDFLPNQPVMALSRELPKCFPQDTYCSDYMVADSSPQHKDLSRCKLLVYGTLVKHYSHVERPQLLPEHLTDVYAAIIDLLVNAKLDKALEALQLCLKLLPPSCRKELHSLLTFMSLAADPQGIKLDKEMENRLSVKKSFSRGIIHSRTLSKEQDELMVMFMLSNQKEIFKIPGALHKVVSDKLANIAQGKHPDVTGSSFCQQVSSGSVDCKLNTNCELTALLNNIHKDANISAKKKRGLFRQFYQSHPKVFDTYFGDTALSVL